jgi:hypothetical protein
VNINNQEAAIMPQGYAVPDCRVQAVDTARAEARGFTAEDVLWSIGIWGVILTLSPVIVFYMLMVA